MATISRVVQRVLKFSELLRWTKFEDENQRLDVDHDTWELAHVLCCPVLVERRSLETKKVAWLPASCAAWQFSERHLWSALPLGTAGETRGGVDCALRITAGSWMLGALSRVVVLSGSSVFWGRALGLILYPNWGP